MTENTEKKLRQADNKVTVVGILAESTLEIKSFDEKEGSGKYEAITGDLTIKVSEDESHVVTYFQKKLTKEGNVNKNFKALTTVMNEYASIADIAQGLKEGEPTKLKANGEITLNEFYANGELISRPRINGKFSPSRIKNEADFTPEATFDTEAIIKSVQPEMEQGEETGRMKINTFIPTYSSVIPVTFITHKDMKPEHVDYVQSNFTQGLSIRLYGDFINFSKKIVRVVEAVFGENTEDVTYENVQELAVKGGVPYEEDGAHEKKIFDLSLLKKAQTNRERHLATLKERAEQKKNEAPKKDEGFGTGASNTAPSTSVPKDVVGDLGDLFGED